MYCHPLQYQVRTGVRLVQHKYSQTDLLITARFLAEFRSAIGDHAPITFSTGPLSPRSSTADSVPHVCRFARTLLHQFETNFFHYFLPEKASLVGTCGPTFYHLSANSQSSPL
jgi:hypothetical protein